eukprot:TRINITY_DN1047_c0_g1_i1.p2 TRINITY_DN1047_c0_g1~~TRINITY_DN1047_c0_g1_i1.p2  ORF type:complete len:176 (+),score=26.63 TRINITY_DN1047_c0_g1_i1:529-1056(+)
MRMEPLMVSDSRTLLLAIDGSEGSDLAVDWAINNYCKPVDKVQLIHVRPPADELVRYRLAEAAVAKLELEADVGSRELIGKYTRRFSKANLDCGWKLAVGDAREEICKEVLRVCADVLIVGSRGHSAIRRAFVGSISDHCAHQCACPVIIVRGKDGTGVDGEFVCDERLLGGDKK